MTLFRIAQEALINVVRHAHASVVDIGLMTAEKQIVLTIQDDGKGVSAAAIESSESLGIIGMRERAALINGTVSINGSPEQGTKVTVTVPLQPKSESDDAPPAG